MRLEPFETAPLPRVAFGEGKLERLPELAASYGSRMLLVTGRSSFLTSGHWDRLRASLASRSVDVRVTTVEHEPSPELVDEMVRNQRVEGVDVVVAVGGGSVIDAGKAVAGLLPQGNSVFDHLEGVGRGVPYRGPSTPFLAVPTTAGTGSEATRNAVLSRRGRGGFKKSFRHDVLVPRWAIVDPTLLASCPPALIAADGMDALTQLIESFVSTRSSALTRALCVSGLEAVREGLVDWYSGTDSGAGRAGMAYAALLSGVALAQTGLGAVHGLASPLGAFFPIPHGVACGTLLATATRVNIAALERRGGNDAALSRYARLGDLLSGQRHESPVASRRALVGLLADWTERMGLARLGVYGVGPEDVAEIVANSRGSSMKTNPVVLADDEIAEIVHERI